MAEVLNYSSAESKYINDIFPSANKSVRAVKQRVLKRRKELPAFAEKFVEGLLKVANFQKDEITVKAKKAFIKSLKSKSFETIMGDIDFEDKKKIAKTIIGNMFPKEAEEFIQELSEETERYKFFLKEMQKPNPVHNLIMKFLPPPKNEPLTHGQVSQIEKNISKLKQPTEEDALRAIKQFVSDNPEYKIHKEKIKTKKIIRKWVVKDKQLLQYLKRIAIEGNFDITDKVNPLRYKKKLLNILQKRSLLSTSDRQKYTVTGYGNEIFNAL